MLVIAAYEMRPPRRLADQTGMAVAIALLILALVSLLGITLMGLSVTESQIGSNEADLKKALFAAEAGIQEAMYRMRLPPSDPLAPLTDEGDTPCGGTADPVVIGKQGTPAPSWADPGSANFWYYYPTTAPACSAWDYLGSNAAGSGNYLGGSPGNLDTAGRTFKFCSSTDTGTYCTSANYAHKGGNALANANLANGGSYTVTVAPVVGHNGTCWQYVDQRGNPLPGSSCAPASLPEPFNPLFKVTSTGTAGNAQKVLSTMIRRFSVNPKPDGALTANTNVNIQSAAAVINGRNHDCDGNNPSDVDAKYAATAPSGPSGVSNNQDGNLICAAGTGDVCKGPSSLFPSTIGELLLLGNDPPPTQSQIDALNAYLESIKILPAQAPTSAFHGIRYIDGNYEEPPDGSTGILIVHHRNPNGVNGCTNPGGCDVANLGNFNEGTFKGLIITDKINKINGSAQIIGSIFAFGSAADGVAVDDVSGTPTIKYSKCIMNDLPNLANFPFEVVKGTWHEQ